MSDQKQTSLKNNPTKKYIIIDTCVLIHAGDKNKDLSNKVLTYLKELSETYSLAISEVTLFEILENQWGDKAVEATNLTSLFEKKDISKEVLVMASLLGGVYKKAGINKSQIGLGDKIISATTLLLDGLVLTTDYQDFPSPFFFQKEWKPIIYKKNHHTRTKDLILYEPNVDIINGEIAKNESQNLKKSKKTSPQISSSTPPTE